MMKKTTRRVLAWALTLALVLALAPHVLAADYSGWTSFTADFSQSGHEIRHLAMGCLYGIGEEDVPTTNLLTPIRPYTFEQKPPDGLQHPTGDAVLTAKTFLESGGQWIQVGCPDIKAGWYYEEPPFASKANYDLYKSQLADMARKCVEAGLSGRCVYNIFNETDGNGGSWDVDNATWFAAWKDFVETIRAIDPQARFSGPGYANFNGNFIRDWLKFCVANDCEPYQVTIHDLFDDRYNSMENEINTIKSHCEAAGLTDYEVCVNEYGQYENLGNPAGLVKYVATLEDNEASGCLAFWNVGNALDDLAADANEPNGAWWLYKLYAGMTGTTVKCSTSTTKIDLYGLATMDESRKTAYALFGGSYKGNEVLKMTNLNKTQAFKNSAYALVTLRSTTYSGTYGPAEEPYLVYRRVLPIENGTVNIPVEGATATTVYYATAIPVETASDANEIEGAWKTTLEGENATRAGGASTVSSNTRYPASNGSLASLPNTGSTLTFRFTVPADGYYEIKTVYGQNTGSNPGNMNNHNPRMGKLDITVDAQSPITQVLDNTMLQLTCDNFSIYPYLSAGEHTIKFQPNASTTGYPVIDCLYVTYTGTESYRYDKTLEAEDADFNTLIGLKSSSLRTEREISEYTGIGYVTGFSNKVYQGGGLRFVAYADAPGMYNLALRYQSNTDEKFGLYLHNTALTLCNKVTDIAAPSCRGWNTVKTTVYLEKGMNILDVDATSENIRLDSINLTKNAALASETTVIEAESGKFSGNTTTMNSDYASGGKLVKGMEGKADGSNALTITYNAPKAGKYQVDIYHSNSELFGNHGTNVAMVDRYVTMSLNGGRARNIFFRNTYSADCIRVKTLTLELKEGENTIKLWNDDQRAYRRNQGGTILLDNFAPNLDKFAFTPVTADLLEEAHEHQTVTVNAKAPTCEGEGYSGEQVCQICGRTVAEGKVLAPTGHTLVDHPGKAPGCVDEGWAAYQTCANCYYTTYTAIAPTGHIYDAGVVTVAPTETTPGVKTFTCIQCGETKTKRIARVGATVPDDIDFTDPASADRFEVVNKSATAIRSGEGLYLITTKDGFEPANDQLSGSAATTPKDLVLIPVEGDWAATMEFTFSQGRASNGYYQFFGFYAMQDYNNAAGIRGGDGAMQNFLRVNGSITADSADLNSSPGLASNGTYWYQLIKEGTTYTCLRSSDGENFTEMFSYEDTGIEADKIAIDAYTGMTEGYEFLIKSLKFEDVGGEPLPHIHAYAKAITAPTCTEKGFTTYTCDCGESYIDDEVPALGHDVKETTIAASCTAAGSITKTCSRCDYKEITEIPALGHNYVNGKCTRCGAKDPDYVCNGGESCPAKGYTDAPKAGTWAHAGIDYCMENKLMNGMSATLFKPNGTVTRGQLVTILYRIAGEPETATEKSFTDVEAGRYYTRAVLWAAENDIVNGYNDGSFKPEAPISREQIATILYRYAGKPNVTGTLDFPDAKQVGDYAKDALLWATQRELITGVKTADDTILLDPKANATRAQIATIIMRYLG